MLLFSKDLNLFSPMLLSDPPENIRKPKVFLYFKGGGGGGQKGTLGRKGLNKGLYLTT